MGKRIIKPNIYVVAHYAEHVEWFTNLLCKYGYRPERKPTYVSNPSTLSMVGNKNTIVFIIRGAYERKDYSHIRDELFFGKKSGRLPNQYDVWLDMSKESLIEVMGEEQAKKLNIL